MSDWIAGSEPWTLAARGVLVLLRASGLVVFCPILGAELLPVRVRVAVALALAVAVLPVVAVPEPTPLPAAAGWWLVTVAGELAVGLAIGLAARVMFAGVESAAGVIAGQSGFAMASMIDPLSGDSGAPTMLFQNLAAAALFLAADLHHLFVRGLVDSYALFPPGTLPELSGLGALTGAFGARVFQIAVELAAPALIVTFAVDLVLVLVGRALPQVQVLTVGYPLKMAAGLVGLAVLLTTTGSALGSLGRTFAADARTMIVALAGAR